MGSKFPISLRMFVKKIAWHLQQIQSMFCENIDAIVVFFLLEMYVTVVIFSRNKTRGHGWGLKFDCWRWIGLMIFWGACSSLQWGCDQLMDVRSQGHAEADLSTPRSGGPEMILLQNSEGFSDTRCHEGKEPHAVIQSAIFKRWFAAFSMNRCQVKDDISEEGTKLANSQFILVGNWQWSV